MGEAIVTKAGGGNSSGGYKLVTEIFNQSGVWTVPSGAKNNLFAVRIFGGGGGGGINSGGGGG